MLFFPPFSIRFNNTISLELQYIISAQKFLFIFDKKKKTKMSKVVNEFLFYMPAGNSEKKVTPMEEMKSLDLKT